MRSTPRGEDEKAPTYVLLLTANRRGRSPEWFARNFLKSIPRDEEVGHHLTDDCVFAARVDYVAEKGVHLVAGLHAYREFVEPRGRQRGSYRLEYERESEGDIFIAGASLGGAVGFVTGYRAAPVTVRCIANEHHSVAPWDSFCGSCGAEITVTLDLAKPTQR